MMKYLIKVILLFLILFDLDVPLFRNSSTMVVAFCAVYYLISRRSIPFTYFIFRYVFVLLAATFLVTIVHIAITVMYSTESVGMHRRFMLAGYIMCCLIFALPILIEEKRTAFKDTVTIICGALALQGFIHTMGFLIEPVGSFLASMQLERAKSSGMSDILQDLMDGDQLFRFFGLMGRGDPIFGIPGAYGISCILFFWLQLLPGQNWLKGWKAFVIMLFILLGITMSGRTGFVGFALGLLLYIVFRWQDFSRLWQNLIKIICVFLLFGLVVRIVLTPQQWSNFENKVMPFAFEAYYNWRDFGEFGTASTDALSEAHYYPVSAETVLLGEGGFSDHRGYMHSDAGYMNNLIFGGVFYILILVIYQFLYARLPMRTAKLQDSEEGNICYFGFLILCVYMLILEYKGFALGMPILEVLLLYVGISYLVERYAIEDMHETQITVD
jgi:hypothetical protein